MPEWLCKPALEWNEFWIPKTNSSSYWDVGDFVDSTKCTASESIAEDTPTGKKAASAAHPTAAVSLLSYESLFLISMFIADEIRALIVAGLEQQQTTGTTPDTPKTTTLVGIPIAVAIPEGPMLPMAILVVHLLNHPFYLNGCGYYAVLVPIEPSEGKDRIRHMLQDTSAMFLLCLQADQQRLEEILISLPKEENPKVVKQQTLESSHDASLLYRSQGTTCLDFRTLLCHQVDRICRGDSKEESILKLHQCLEGITNLTDLPALLYKNNQQQQQLAPSQKKSHTTVAQKNIGVLPNRISHIVYTSGTTGVPKGCISSIQSLEHYLRVKNRAHGIDQTSRVCLASALSFDPCLSDILATLQARGTLVIAPRRFLQESLPLLLSAFQVSHILCTPSLWSTIQSSTPIQTTTTSLQQQQQFTPADFPSLQVVALGGEPIPKQIVQTWARRRGPSLHSQTTEGCNHSEINLQEEQQQSSSSTSLGYTRLLATYGVTEACVYQTCGEVWQEDSCMDGQDVGPPFEGLAFRICNETDRAHLVDVPQEGDRGEIVLCGKQVDALSSYLNQPNHRNKFVQQHSQNNHHNYYYRTGDLGYQDTTTSHLKVLGRIAGERSMVKVNGIRVELSEIEYSILDNYSTTTSSLHTPPVIMDAVVCTRKQQQPSALSEQSSTNMQTVLHAYCVISPACAKEIGILAQTQEQAYTKASMTGILCTSKTLLTLLKARCQEKVRSGVTPSAFILLARLPLSPTGKRDMSRLPKLSDCIPSDKLITNGEKNAIVPLAEYGFLGRLVFNEIISTLNLQPSQQSMLTTASSFGMLGGDSLASTRVVRALYAAHHNIPNGRFLGGEYGIMEGPFSPAYLVRATNLGEYVDFLVQNKVCASLSSSFDPSSPGEQQDGTNKDDEDKEAFNECNAATTPPSSNHDYEERLYNALWEAVSMDQVAIALALLDVGANPNQGEHGGRLGKVSGRNNRKASFRSSPLHLACLKGQPDLVEALLKHGAKYTSPDASGVYPIHLAAVGDPSTTNTTKVVVAQAESEQEDVYRLACVKSLLEAGTPLFMKDGNKQTVLHCAARAGHVQLLKFVMQKWIDLDPLPSHDDDTKMDLHSVNWRDHWYRTPIHWAILNQHVNALQCLLEMGCSPSVRLPKRKIQKRSSVPVETPMEMCQRLYGTSHGVGLYIYDILTSFPQN